MIRTLCILFFLIAGLYVGSHYFDQQGYVLFSIPYQTENSTFATIEMSVTAFVLLFIVFLVLFLILETLLRKGLSGFKGIFNWFSFRKRNLAQQNLQQGLNYLLSGEWKKAEAKLTKYAIYHNDPALCYLLAAESAQQQKKDVLRRKYIELAESHQTDDLSSKITNARQLVANHRYSEAHSVLEVLDKKSQQKPAVLTLLKSVYLPLKMWPELEALLPKLKKQKLVADHEYQYLQQQTYLGLLQEPVLPSELLTYWHMLPKGLKSDPVMVDGMLKRCIEFQDRAQINDTIISLVGQHPTDFGLAVLGEMKVIDLDNAIQVVKKLTQSQSNNPQVYSTLGQLYCQAKQWDKAQTAFETSLKQRVSYKDYAYLAETLEQQNKSQAAREVSRQAFLLAKHQA